MLIYSFYFYLKTIVLKIKMDTEDVIDTILGYADDKTIETFECLKVYFRNLTIEQIEQEGHFMEYSEFINMVEPKDKIIMSVFIHRYLEPYFNKNVVTVKKSEMRFDDNVLDIVNCIESCTSYVSDRELKVFKPKLKLFMDNQDDKIKLIDFSHNNILSGGLPIIVDIIEDLNLMLDCNCIVNVSNNSIHGVGDFRDPVINSVKRLIKNPKIKYLDMTNNQFCSIDQIDFFKLLTKEESEKLIFIAKIPNNVNNNQILINDKNIDVVRKTHIEYYKLKEEMNYR